jgi:cyclopropane fatty-acyl-phospholipid synthase-like methyltransferase
MSQADIRPWSAAAFEARYRGQRDPWHFATSDYEQERYRTTLRSLQRQRYGACFEPGCSVGELTAQLAARCSSVFATDVAPTAVAAARRRCAGMTNVEIACAPLSPQLRLHGFDLIVFSEIGYYFSARALARIARQVRRWLAAQGEFIAVHWLGHSADHRLHADEVHRILTEHLALQWAHGEVHPGYRIDSWIAA